MSKKHIYKVIFQSQGRVYEIYALSISHGGLLGFVEVEELQFGERGGLVVDPAEERIQAEFEGVRRFFLPLHTVIRIDEVEKRGVAKVSKADGNVTQFPVPVYTPGGGPGE